MKIWKQVLAVLTAAVLAAGLGACKNQGDSVNDPSSEVTLKFSCWETGVARETLATTIQQFEDENPGIKVNINFLPADYLVKMTAMSVSNSLPDVGYFVEYATLQWAQNDKFLDLSDIFQKEPLKDKLDMIKFTDLDGKTVAAGIANEVALLFYNKTLFDEAGLSYPPASVENAWTWDQFVQTARILTKDRNGNDANSPAFNPSRIATYGINLTKNNLIYETLMWSNGGGIVDYKTEEILFDSPETIEVLQAIQDLIHTHHVAPTPVMQGTMPVMSAALASGSVAMTIDMQHNITFLDEAAETEGLNYGIGVLPVFKEAVSVNSGSPIVIFKSTEYPEEAKKLFTYLMNPSNVLPLINNGLWMPNEGEWYTDESYIEKWVNEDVHGPEYRTAVIDYTISGSVKQNPFYYYPYQLHLLGAVAPAIDEIYLNTATPAAAAQKGADNLKEAIEYIHSPDFQG